MPVLVLNASYEPINICGARRALVLVLKGIARTEEEHGLTLHAQRSRIAMPSVIRLLGVSPHSLPDARPLAEKHPAARPQHLPVLRRGAASRRADAGPRDSALPRRQLHMGESGGLLPRLQPAKGQPHAARDRRHDPAARPAALLAAYQPADHADAGTRRRPLAEVSVLLVASVRGLPGRSPGSPLATIWSAPAGSTALFCIAHISSLRSREGGTACLLLRATCRVRTWAAEGPPTDYDS